MSPPTSIVIVPPYSPPELCAPAQTLNDTAVSTLEHVSSRPCKDRPQSPLNISLLQGGTEQAEEFNHAIQYLNKIKLRYTDVQATYKTFLDILQTYQEEERHSHDVRLPLVALLIQIR